MDNPFVKALEVMQERGMCKFTQEDAEGHVCVYGALSIALYGATCVGLMKQGGVRWDPTYENNGPLMDSVAKRLFADDPDYRLYGSGAAGINNRPDSTQEDVELILKHCIAEWDELHPAA